jgi:hypothetical protein
MATIAHVTEKEKGGFPDAASSTPAHFSLDTMTNVFLVLRTIFIIIDTQDAVRDA